MFYTSIRIREQKNYPFVKKRAEIECYKSLSVLLDEKNGMN